MRNRNRIVGALGAAIMCGIVAGCGNSAATPTAGGTTAPPTASSAPPTTGAAPPALVLQAVEALRADEAAALSPQLRAGARTARNAQLAASKSLSSYTAALGNGCGASPAAFRQSLSQLQATVAAYDRLLASAGVFMARLPGDAARVAAATKKAGIAAPVDLRSVNAQYAAFRTDAHARAGAVPSLQTRAANAYARCIAKASRPPHRH